jgi:hypothetical protein
MRTAAIAGSDALRERISTPAQIDASIPESAMPPYMEMFLAHLRLLIGAPFEYLVADSRLLPDESIRFFYLDRSWTDRLVDGALAVGKIGSREQAHHQAHSADVQGQLDLTERAVRTLQRGLTPDTSTAEQGGVVTGFLLRSAAVRGWPAMDVRAFSQIVPESQGDVNDPKFASWAENAAKVQLRTLRLELLSPSVLLALFDGIPALVWLEEPHHGVQFGVVPGASGFALDRHEASGATEPGETPAQMVPVPVRAANHRVLAIQALRKRLNNLRDPNLAPQTGSGNFAIELLNYPWRQRFENNPQSRVISGAFISKYQVAQVITNPDLKRSVEEAL